MATQLSNYFLYQVLLKTVNLSSDTCKIALMQSGFAFNRASHHVYADVSASELGTAVGYTAGGATLAGVSVSQDNTNNRGKVTWNNVSWTITGGNLVAAGAIIYDTTATNMILGYIDFGGDETTLDGGVFTIANPLLELDGGN